MTTIANRPLATVKAQAPIKTVAAPAPTSAKPAVSQSMPTVLQPVGVALPTFQRVIQIFSQAGTMFTPPVIVDIFKSSVKSGFGLQNLAWQVIPSAIRNARDVFSDKISVARGVGNVSSETVLGVAKGIAAGVVVQSASIAIGPLLGLLPANPMLLMGAGLVVSLGGLVATYWGLNKLIKKTGLDQKIADGVTNLIGGDKAPAPAAPSAAKAA